MSEPVDRHVRKLLADPEFVVDLEARRMTRPFDPTTGEPDPFTDDIYVEPYEPEPFPVGWSYIAAILVAGIVIVAILLWWPR